MYCKGFAHAVCKTFIFSTKQREEPYLPTFNVTILQAKFFPTVYAMLQGSLHSTFLFFINPAIN